MLCLVRLTHRLALIYTCKYVVTCIFIVGTIDRFVIGVRIGTDVIRLLTNGTVIMVFIGIRNGAFCRIHVCIERYMCSFRDIDSRYITMTMMHACILIVALSGISFNRAVVTTTRAGLTCVPNYRIILNWRLSGINCTATTNTSRARTPCGRTRG